MAVPSTRFVSVANHSETNYQIDDDGKADGRMKRAEQQRKRIICSRYYTFTEPAPPTIPLTKEVNTKKISI
jgi:hypothetical protein